MCPKSEKEMVIIGQWTFVNPRRVLIVFTFLSDRNELIRERERERERDRGYLSDHNSR